MGKNRKIPVKTEMHGYKLYILYFQDKGKGGNGNENVGERLEGECGKSRKLKERKAD